MRAQSELRDPGSFPRGGGTQAGMRARLGSGARSATALLTHLHFCLVFTERPRASNSSIRKQMFPETSSYIFPLPVVSALSWL